MSFILQVSLSDCLCPAVGECQVKSVFGKDCTVLINLHMDSHYARLQWTIVTEYTTLIMNPAVSHLLCLCQSNRAIEEYV